MNLVFLWWSTSKVSVSFVSRTFFIYILIGINASPRLHSLTIETFPTEDGTPYNGLYGGGGGLHPKGALYLLQATGIKQGKNFAS